MLFLWNTWPLLAKTKSHSSVCINVGIFLPSVVSGINSSLNCSGRNSFLSEFLPGHEVQLYNRQTH